jgi:hypothetical protein
MTARQNRTERWAVRIEQLVGTNRTSTKLRADNRRTEKRKRVQFKRKGGE